MDKNMNRKTADLYCFLRDHFEDAARAFCEHSEGVAPWGDVWDSEPVQSHLLGIARDIAHKDAMDEDAMNNFVDARLKALPWVSICGWTIADILDQN